MEKAIPLVVMPESNTDVRITAITVINRVLRESGRPERKLGDDDSLTGTIGLDSLDLATTVVHLENELGVDPFRDGATPVRTVGELVVLYAKSVKEKS